MTGQQSNQLRRSLRRMFFVPLAMICAIPVGILLIVVWFIWEFWI
jgi:hypothetical protein